MTQPLIPTSLPESQAAIRSRDVVAPALLVLAQAARLGTGPLSSQEVAQALEPAMPLSGLDKERLPDRTTRFSRTVRNALVSHRVLERDGLAEASRAKDDIRVRLAITQKGQVALFDQVLPLFLSTVPSLKELSALPAGEAEAGPKVVDGAPRTLASDVVDLALLALVATEAENGGQPVAASDIRMLVKATPGLRVSPQDMVPTKSTKEPALDRTIRNVTTSHDTLVKLGFAVRAGDGKAVALRSTPAGKVHLLNHYVLAHLPAPPVLEEALARVDQPPASKAPRRRTP